MLVDQEIEKKTIYTIQKLIQNIRVVIFISNNKDFGKRNIANDTLNNDKGIHSK